MALPTNSGQGNNQGNNRPRGIPVPKNPPAGPRPPRPAPPQQESGYVDDSFEPLSIEETLDEFYYDERPPAPAPAEIPEVSMPRYEIKEPEPTPPSRPQAQPSVPAEQYEPPAEPTFNDLPQQDPSRAHAEDVSDLASLIDESDAEDSPKRKKKLSKKDQGESPNFINKKQKKIKPYGGDKSKKKTKANEVDAREDRRQKAKIIQIGVIGLLVVLVLFGFYNAVIPKPTLSADDVNTLIAQNNVNSTFPLERGQVFAEDFLNEYLTVDNSGQENPLLGYYYTGEMGGSVSSTATVEGDFLQRVLVSPKVYKSTVITEYSASYEVSAFVQRYSSETEEAVKNAEANNEPVDEVLQPRWVSYNVNIYYDDANNTIAVTKDSPTLLPPTVVANGDEIPTEKAPGTGETNDELDSEVQSTIYGYMKAFGESSLQSHETADQYLKTDNTDPSLYSGLANKYILSGEPENAIDYSAYITDDPDIIRVDTTVNWLDSLTENVRDTYTIRYLIELERQSNGQYLVVYIAPRTYASAEAEAEGE